MIFIHGWGFSKKVWEGFEGYGEQIDLPFHGNNVLYLSKHNIIASFVDGLASGTKKPTTFVGWSLGASVCILLALRYPEKVKNLVLVGFSPKFNDKTLGSDPKRVKAFMFSLRRDFSDTVYNFRKAACGSEFINIPLPEKNGATTLLKEYINLDLTESLKDIQHHTWIIHGKKDAIVNPQAAIFTSNRIKNSNLILLESHHAPFLHYKDKFVNLLEKIG